MPTHPWYTGGGRAAAAAWGADRENWVRSRIRKPRSGLRAPSSATARSKSCSEYRTSAGACGSVHAGTVHAHEHVAQRTHSLSTLAKVH